MPVSNRPETPGRQEAADARRGSSQADERRRGEEMVCAAALFTAIVLSWGQAGLDILESNRILRKHNYLSEVKESGSHAHSTSPIHSALIPVNSLARMKVHEESSHNHSVGGQEPLSSYCSFSSLFHVPALVPVEMHQAGTTAWHAF